VTINHLCCLQPYSTSHLTTANQNWTRIKMTFWHVSVAMSKMNDFEIYTTHLSFQYIFTDLHVRIKISNSHLQIVCSVRHTKRSLRPYRNHLSRNIVICVIVPQSSLAIHVSSYYAGIVEFAQLGILCSKSYSFMCIIFFTQKATGSYHNNNYNCDTCKQNKTVNDDGIWHCSECQFDLCPDCLD
jgi:hypothetical protein